MKIISSEFLKSVAGGINPELEGLSPNCAAVVYYGLLYLFQQNEVPLSLSTLFYQECSCKDIEIINQAAWPIWKALLQFTIDLSEIAIQNQAT